MIKKILKNPFRIFSYFAIKGLFDWMPDEPYVKLMYRAQLGHKLNLKDPKTYNEKLQWLKLHDRNPLYTTLVDKYAVRNYIAQQIGEEYLIPLVGGPWNSFDEIDFDALPDQFVLKCTHDSGGLVICQDKSKWDRAAAKKKIDRCLKINYYTKHREWPYKDVPHRIIAEKLMVDESRSELKDYKVMCFGGTPQMIQVHSGRFQNHTQDYYDTNWKFYDISQGYPPSQNRMDKPKFLDKMLELSSTLSSNYAHVRVDWYYTNEQLYFGEITLYDGSGYEGFEPKEYDGVFGDWIDLSNAFKGVTKN